MSIHPEITFLFFPGCPNAEPAKHILAIALKELNLPSSGFMEINIYDPSCPQELSQYPSPTILIAGSDIEGMLPQSGSACRIYDGKDGVPTVEKIKSAISEHL